MRLNCPHCHHPIELVEPVTLDALPAQGAVPGSSATTCPVCGSELPMFESTLSYQGERRERIGQYELREELGQGQFGVVWKAWDTELDRMVALKIPRTTEIFEKGEELFRKEARAIAALDHPNIVRLYEVRREVGQIVIVTEYVAGATLQQHLANAAYPFRQSAEICRQIADALHHAHERGVVHRDIKPNNVLINTEGVPKVADFGLAKRDAAEITMTMDGQVLGTPAYMPPEQAQGHSHAADRRSDVYSLGVVLYEMLTGSRPFKGSSRALLDQVISCDPRAPRRIVKSIPRDLETICLTAMAKAPARRYQTAAAFAADLQRFLKGEVIVARPASAFERCWKWSRRHPWQIATTILAVAAIFFGMAWNVTPKPVAAEVETRTVLLDTVPTNAELVFYLRDPHTGEPDPASAIRPTTKSPTTVTLPVGDYLVVAVLDEKRFHEVYRRVPGKSAGLASSYKHLTWEVTSDDRIKLPDINIPGPQVVDQMSEFAGSSRFEMGIAGDPFVPRHARSIPPFYLDPHEVTFRQFRELIKRPPLPWPPKTVLPDENVPATKLFHDDAIVFAERAGKRLMTEAEYEFAATKGGTRTYPWGDANPPDPAKWPIGPVSDNSTDLLDSQTPVYGLFSNAAEWTDTWATPYPDHLAMKIDMGDTLKQKRMVRGAPPHVAAGLSSTATTVFTPRHRVMMRIDELPPNVGFRMARSLRPRLKPEDFGGLLNSRKFVDQ